MFSSHFPDHSSSSFSESLPSSCPWMSASSLPVCSLLPIWAPLPGWSPHLQSFNFSLNDGEVQVLPASPGPSLEFRPSSEILQGPPWSSTSASRPNYMNPLRPHLLQASPFFLLCVLLKLADKWLWEPGRHLNSSVLIISIRVFTVLHQDCLHPEDTNSSALLSSSPKLCLSLHHPSGPSPELLPSVDLHTCKSDLTSSV